MLSKTMLGDLAVFWLYVSLICSFLHYITLHYNPESRARNSIQDTLMLIKWIKSQTFIVALNTKLVKII